MSYFQVLCNQVSRDRGKMTANEKQPACSTLMEAESLDGFLFSMLSKGPTEEKGCG